MEDIPVTYEWKGKEVTHCLSFTKGMAAYIWDLHTIPERDGKAIRYWHLGELVLQKEYEWVLRIKGVDYPKLAEYFGAVLISWYQ